MNNMNRFALFPVAILLASAFAFADTPAGPPKMTFRAFPPETKVSTTDKVTRFRSLETVIVVIKDTVRCGQKPVKASFAIKTSQIILRIASLDLLPGMSHCLTAIVTEGNGYGRQEWHEHLRGWRGMPRGGSTWPSTTAYL
jgi:hypothetical protein